MILYKIIFYMSFFSSVVYGQHKQIYLASNTEKAEQSWFVNPPLATITSAVKKKQCNRFRNKFISYYAELYWVTSKCIRQKLNNKQMLKITLLGRRVHDVDSLTIESLKEGPSYQRKSKRKIDCQKLRYNYISFTLNNVYWVNGACLRQLFPDWASYENHRSTHNYISKPLIEVSYDELMSLKASKTFPSIIDKEYKKLVKEEPNIEVLPIDEACKGLIGRYVTYYSEIFYIQGISHSLSYNQFCAKRRVDSQEFTFKNIGRSFHLTELTSSQYISIPLSKSPMLRYKVLKKPKDYK